MFDKDSLHHAYFIEGERDAVVSEVEAFLRDSLGIVRQGNPDFHFAEHESFGIDESRALQGMQALRPVAGDKKIFVLAVDAVTSEAQNSLLKVFEEPTPGTHFFVIASTRRILLPTLQSRMRLIVHSSSREASYAEAARAFIRMAPKERLAKAGEMVEEKDKAKAEAFLLALVAELEKDLGKKPETARTIKELLSSARYLKDRAPSLKLILERAALLMI